MSGNSLKTPSQDRLRNRPAMTSSGSTKGQPRSTSIAVPMARRVLPRLAAMSRCSADLARSVIGPSGWAAHPAPPSLENIINHGEREATNTIVKGAAAKVMLAKLAAD